MYIYVCVSVPLPPVCVSICVEGADMSRYQGSSKREEKRVEKKKEIKEKKMVEKEKLKGTLAPQNTRTFTNITNAKTQLFRTVSVFACNVIEL